MRSCPEYERAWMEKMVERWGPTTASVRAPTMECVSNRRRCIVDMGRWEYIYIPLRGREADLLAPGMQHPCLRIWSPKREGGAGG